MCSRTFKSRLLINSHLLYCNTVFQRSLNMAVSVRMDPLLEHELELAAKRKG